jgi:uncharacterized protein YjbI with pentapeptide repeats
LEKYRVDELKAIEQQQGEQPQDEQQQSPWQLTRKQVLWASRIVAVLTVAVLIGYRYGITLWDWIKLLIVPVVIAGGGIWFNRQQRERELALAEKQRERELALEENRAQDEALQTYIESMEKLLLEKNLRAPLEESADSRLIARARTLTVLDRLNGGRKRQVVRFLNESGLIDKADPVVLLFGADLSGVNLMMLTLDRTDLSGTYLNEAVLMATNLSGANLSQSILNGATLRMVNLSGADLTGASLSEAYWFGVDLEGADLREADLRDATIVTDDDLNQAKSLAGATMPNGQKYQD